MDMVDPPPTLVERLVRHVLLPREFLPQIGINSIEPAPLRFKRQRAHAPKPFAGLTQRPHCAACAHNADHPQVGPVRTSVSPAEKRYLNGLNFNVLQMKVRGIASEGHVGTFSVSLAPSTPFLAYLFAPYDSLYLLYLLT
jgi:hypothetical protein